MKLLKTTLLLVFSFLILSLSAHKYYMSFTKINYAENEKSLQITSRIFIDDLELAINKKNNIKLQLDTKNELKNSNKYIADYIKTHLKIAVNDIEKNFNYLGKEYDGDAVKLYLEIENIKTIKSIKVESSVLVNEFYDQQNIVKLKIYNKKKTFLLNADETEDTLNF